jgi:uncharacterized protein (TIGR02265 family)
MSTKVKGAVLLSRGEFVRSEFGEEAWGRVLEELSPEVREQLEGTLLTSTWYPFEISKEMDQAIVDVLGGGDLDIFKRIGAWSARANLTGPHRAFVSAGNPQALLALTDRIYKFYYDTGYREYEETGPDSGIMTTYEADVFSENDCLTVMGWYEEAIRMCGATRVVITEESCRARGDSCCRYRLRWEI